MKANSLFFLALLVVACGAVLPEVQNTASQTAEAPAPQFSSPEIRDSVPQNTTASPVKPDTARKTILPSGTRLSAGVADILKMMDGKIDPAVIETYIQNSNIAYYPNADEILQLHKAGVPSQLITALIRRGTELRGQQAQAYREMQEKLAQPRPSTVAAVIEPAAPSAPMVVPQAEYNYYTSPSYNYPAYSYGGYYPAYSYGWTLPFYSSFYYQSSRPFHSGLRHPNVTAPRLPRVSPVIGSGSHQGRPVGSPPRSSVGPGPGNSRRP